MANENNPESGAVQVDPTGGLAPQAQAQSYSAAIQVASGDGRQPRQHGAAAIRGPAQGQRQIDPRAVDPLVNEGKGALERNDVTLAELRVLQALQQVPDHLDALILLYQVKRKTGVTAGPQIESVLRRIVRASPNLLWATSELAFMLFSRGERVECEMHARNAIRLAPRNAQAHGIMGLILTETNRASAGEYHFRRSIEIGGEHARVCANLANCLKAQGKVEESEEWYRKATALDPANPEIWLNWCRMEEARRDIPRAWELLGKAEEVAPPSADLNFTRAVLYGREKKNEEAVAELSRSQAEGKVKQMTAVALLERGRLYDKMNRFEEAWADFHEGKRLCRDVQGRRYNEQYARDLVERLKRFFTRQRMKILPRATRDIDMPQPVFIVGYPRSGTTMVEQTIGAHPSISAGDELVFINDLTRMGSRMLGSPLQYPECLSDLWMGDNQLGLDQFRDFYLRRSEQLGIWEPGARFFTDKMPLNETHLGLIHLIFPESPIVHVRRHPLDILLSNFSNFLTHGFHQAFDVRTCATHYVLIDGLVEHYKQHLDMKYIDVRYEDLVEDQEPNVRRILDFIGVEFDPKTLDFHENQRYARTASYAQVTEKLYDSSVHRYRHYRKHLDEAVRILKPVLDRLGYPAD